MTKVDYFASDSKRELLLLLKRIGAVSLDDAEEDTGLARTTLREHFSRLERDGLVTQTTHRDGPGRPSLRFHLTTRGQALFPSRDGALLRQLLSYLDEHGAEDLIHAFFEEFWDERLREFRHRLRGATGDEASARILVLEAFLSEQGFMPEIETGESGLTIRECNCPFPEAVKHTRLPCRLEARFFESIFGESIGRVTYIPDGSPACTYEFPEAGKSPC